MRPHVFWQERVSPPAEGDDEQRVLLRPKGDGGGGGAGEVPELRGTDHCELELPRENHCKGHTAEGEKRRGE